MNQLREAILEGRLPQGERLSEVDLSQTLGVSRGPAREALLHLEQEGLVVIGCRPQPRGLGRTIDTPHIS